MGAALKYAPVRAVRRWAAHAGAGLQGADHFLATRTSEPPGFASVTVRAGEAGWVEVGWVVSADEIPVKWEGWRQSGP